MFRKYIIIIIVFLIIFVLCAAASAVLLGELSKQGGLIFTVFRPELQKASNGFYSEYLSDNPSVANYSGKIISIKKDENGYYIKFAIQPYLGPHFPVGDDEAEYYVDNLGTVTLLKFSHRKSYDIPPRLGVTIKKPIPIS
jgi:hypothetical protein